MKFVTAKMKKDSVLETSLKAKAVELRQEVMEDTVPTAKDLKQALSGSINDRLMEDRAIVLTMKHGEKPDVRLDGFWNGRLVKNAMNAISRNYRLRRHKQIRPNAVNKGD